MMAIKLYVAPLSLSALRHFCSRYVPKIVDHRITFWTTELEDRGLAVTSSDRSFSRISSQDFGSYLKSLPDATWLSRSPFHIVIVPVVFACFQSDWLTQIFGLSHCLSVCLDGELISDMTPGKPRVSVSDVADAARYWETASHNADWMLRSDFVSFRKSADGFSEWQWRFRSQTSVCRFGQYKQLIGPLLSLRATIRAWRTLRLHR